MLRQVKYAFIVAGAVLIAALIYVDLPGFPEDQNSTDVASSTVQLKGLTIRVTVADTPEEREQGLSGWTGLSEDEGMLFVFEKDGEPAFWMKDMKFAIDILWISSEGVVVDMRQDVSPETYPTAFAPRSEARYVLELPAGYTEVHQVRLEDIVRL